MSSMSHDYIACRHGGGAHDKQAESLSRFRWE